MKHAGMSLLLACGLLVAATGSSQAALTSEQLKAIAQAAAQAAPPTPQQEGIQQETRQQAGPPAAAEVAAPAMPEKKEMAKESALDIFSQIGQGASTHQAADPAQLEREARELDLRLEQAFGNVDPASIHRGGQP